MIACSNTTPFIALCSIGRLDLLPSVFGSIHVPRSVADECAAGGPIPVPALSTLPWVVVDDDPPAHLAFDGDLGAGERSAIALALSLKADWLLIDEALGRTVAEYHSVPVVGTLGVLARAARDGLIPSFREAALAMRAQGIRFSEALIAKIQTRLDTVPKGPQKEG